MRYNGKESLPMVKMLLQARWSLEEVLGVSVPWTEDGPACDLPAPLAGGTIRVQRHFGAETGRLIVITILVKPVSLDDREMVTANLAASKTLDDSYVFLRMDGCLALKEVIEVLPDDVTPLFMGKLLDRTLKQIVRVAEAAGILDKT